MIRVISVILTALAAASALAFVTLYLGGYAGALDHERIALAPLIAGLGAALAEGYRRGNLSRLTAVAGTILLAAWLVFLRFPF